MGIADRLRRLERATGGTDNYYEGYFISHFYMEPYAGQAYAAWPRGLRRLHDSLMLTHLGLALHDPARLRAELKQSIAADKFRRANGDPIVLDAAGQARWRARIATADRKAAEARGRWGLPDRGYDPDWLGGIAYGLGLPDALAMEIRARWPEPWSGSGPAPEPSAPDPTPTPEPEPEIGPAPPPPTNPWQTFADRRPEDFR